jgi:hypothetical protein
VSQELAKAREQFAAGQYKKAVSTLWDAERWARSDLAEARELLEVASAIRDVTSGRLKADCVLLVEDAEKYIQRETEPGGKVLLGRARYLGGCQAFGPACEGGLSFSANAVFLDSMRLDLASIKSVAVGGGQIAKSRVGATLAFGIAGLAAKGAQDRTEIALHLNSGDAAFFVIDGVSPFELRAKLLPLLRDAGIPLKDKSDEQPGAPDAAGGEGPAYSLGDELAKLAQLHEKGVLTDAELAAAKAKLLS